MADLQGVGDVLLLEAAFFALGADSGTEFVEKHLRSRLHGCASVRYLAVVPNAMLPAVGPNWQGRACCEGTTGGCAALRRSEPHTAARASFVRRTRFQVTRRHTTIVAGDFSPRHGFVREPERPPSWRHCPKYWPITWLATRRGRGGERRGGPGAWRWGQCGKASLHSRALIGIELHPNALFHRVLEILQRLFPQRPLVLIHVKDPLFSLHNDPAQFRGFQFVKSPGQTHGGIPQAVRQILWGQSLFVSMDEGKQECGLGGRTPFGSGDAAGLEMLPQVDSQGKAGTSGFPGPQKAPCVRSIACDYRRKFSWSRR